MMADTRERTLTLSFLALVISAIMAWMFAVTIVRYLQANERIRKLSQAVEQAGESVIITDTDGTIEYVNAAFTKVTGFSAEEALGNNPRILKSGNQPDEYYKRLWDTITQGDVFHSSVIDRRKDGSQYPALMTVSPILDQRGDITHYVGIQQDMTVHNELQEQFRQAQKMETLGALIGGIAHDFNNLLTGITGNIMMATFDLEDKPEVKSKLEMADKLAFQAAHMIKQLMAYSRKGIVIKKPFALISMIDEMLPLLKTSFPESISFNFAPCKHELVIKGDSTQLQQVLLNMINNARDALDGINNPLISLRVEAFEADESFIKKHSLNAGNQFAHIIVEDNGCGIPEDQITHLFEPFFTTKEIGLGTGLGLSMAFGTIQSHHGVIEVESTRGEGTAFHIYLPVIEEEKVTMTSDISDEVETGNGELILVVDDNADVRATVKAILNRLNYDVIEAYDGLNAVDQFVDNQQNIRLIIMDVVMPRLGGVKAAERIWKAEAGTSIIFSTGYDRDETLKNEMPSEDCPVLTKPYTVAKLSQLIQAQLKRSKH